jgi:hypothetical protein
MLSDLFKIGIWTKILSILMIAAKKKPSAYAYPKNISKQPTVVVALDYLPP